MSVRWDPSDAEAYLKFAEKWLQHPVLADPVEVFAQDDLICTVIPYRNESLLLDECSPLSVQSVLRHAHRGAGLLAFLHQHGIRIGALEHAHFVIRDNEDLILLDPPVAEASDEPIAEDERADCVAHFAALLQTYLPVDFDRLHEFFERATQGGFGNPYDFGRAVEEFLPQHEDSTSHRQVAALTDVGLFRQLNEDTWNWTELGEGVYLYVVADGMGGHDSGEVASTLAASTICSVAHDRMRSLENPTAESVENVLDEAFQAANNTVKNLADERGSDMGTTLVAVLTVGDDLALMANVGDSRGYLLRGDTLHPVTRDHSLVARMVEQGRITPAEARTHPHGNILLRTVGTERDVQPDIVAVETESEDRLLLCSDGLWGEVEDEDIEAIMNQHADPRLAARELVRAAHRGGGKDNITVLIVDIR
jgi:serine/threonine protein phosphatase PrpC